MSSTPSDAEDATQEIYLQIWSQAARFDESRGSEKTFVAMIARRRLIDRFRRAAAEPLMVSCDEPLDSLTCPRGRGTSESCRDAEQALQALAQLRPEYREVLELGLLYDLTQQQISTRLSLPLGTVKSFMRRGLMHVREHLNVGVGLNAAAPRVQTTTPVLSLEGA
jgi:RNA polymerase sigma-70 factor (ECF subfamily)